MKLARATVKMSPLRNLVTIKTYRDTPLGKDEVVAIFKQQF